MDGTWEKCGQKKFSSKLFARTFRKNFSQELFAKIIAELFVYKSEKACIFALVLALALRSLREPPVCTGTRRARKRLQTLWKR
jgi:hypothetical protein